MRNAEFKILKRKNEGQGFRVQVFFFDRIYRINWIFSFGRSPEESAQTPIACGEFTHNNYKGDESWKYGKLKKSI